MRLCVILQPAKESAHQHTVEHAAGHVSPCGLQRLREQAQKRVEKQQAALELLRMEKELESRRCQLCDLIRAQAWGMGHANWMERRCSK